MTIDTHGDIQDRDDVEPASDTTFGLVKELLQTRGRTHVYYPNHRDQDAGAHDDIHLEADTTYLFPDIGDDGLIFVQHGDVQRWLFPEHILYIENHYE